ncbi:MAG: ABC transporter ATP-binding protein [Candidatus Omnitrophica bacterium]|nr:ABC transporter ATP-binding protein [Candidatus Omnitrophota bacterium]MDD5351924.1 ABC transporter ATP-binding protein [Candidatus Omnitrophota bacterium]MDD5550750.1 ABC transporter ATP-binding protein [Candidatus Omnitrophota bacterium]
MLEAIGLTKEYEVGLNVLEVLKGIDLSVKKGEVLGIVGPSGAGKSTLLHLLGGLDDPTRGKVLLEGTDIAELNDKKRAQLRNIYFGFVFQFYHLLSEFTAVENVMLPALITNRESRSRIKEKAQVLLKRCGLLERLYHRPSELSGGEQQRVAIARALINRPQILFCDEPTGNLDTETGSSIKNLLWQLNKEYNTTLLIVTHAQEIVKDATRIIHLKDGKMLN